MHWVDFASPHSVREAVDLLNEAGDSARMMAGGTDILVQLRAGVLSQVGLIIDVKNIPELITHIWGKVRDGFKGRLPVREVPDHVESLMLRHSNLQKVEVEVFILNDRNSYFAERLIL